jgi:hypothetical protein
MQINFEHFAATSLLRSSATPPRKNGELLFSQLWEARAFGMAIALSKNRAFRVGGV